MASGATTALTSSGSNRREAKIIIESWRQHYNTVRPHMSLQYLRPLEFKQRQQTTSTLQLTRAISQEINRLRKVGQVT